MPSFKENDYNPWIEYREHDQFIEYIRKSELLSKLEHRLEQAFMLLNDGTIQESCVFMNIHYHQSINHEHINDLLVGRIVSLQNRILKLKWKENTNANI